MRTRLTTPKTINFGRKKTNLVKRTQRVYDNFGKGQVTQRNKITRTWKGNKPKFSAKKPRGQIGLNVKATGTHLGVWKYIWLSYGTDIRYATMTKKPKFQAKTRYRIIGSRKGRGGLAYVSTQHPRPGIEARWFEGEIMKRTTPTLIKNLEKAGALTLRSSR
jgi:hypothetical protein